MKYLVLAYGAEKDWQALTESERNELAAQDAFMRARGDTVAALQTTSTLVRAWDGIPVTEDGPFAKADLPLVGFGIIEAVNIGEAVRIVKDTPCARARGVVELRPIAALNL